MAHNHEIIDSDVSFVIDPITRAITTDSSKLCLVQYDHNSEKYTFKVPRFIEGHDMITCDTIAIDFTNTTRRKDNSNVGAYLTKEIDVADDYLMFTWVISQDATQLVGYLTFSVSFRCHDANDNIIYEWGTDTYQRITVLEKTRNIQSIVEKYPDIIEQIKEDVMGSAVRSVNGAIPDENGNVDIELPEPIQTDWSQNDSNGPDYVKNRTHHMSLLSTSHPSYDVPIIEKPIRGTTMVSDWTDKDMQYVRSYYDYSGQIDHRQGCFLRCSYIFTSSSTGYQAPFVTNADSTRISKIDDVNFCFSVYPFTWYLIFDTSVLSENYNTMFTKRGIYLECAMDPASISNVKLDVVIVSRLDVDYLPTNVLLDKDKESILSGTVRTVNGSSPDEHGNVDIPVPEVLTDDEMNELMSALEKEVETDE